MSYDTKKMKKRMLITRLILAVILTAFFIYFVYQVALEDKGDAPQQASADAEDTFMSWMKDSLYSSKNYSIRLYLPDGFPENTLDFSSLEALPFWNWVNVVAKGNSASLDIAVDRLHKTAAFNSGGEYRFLSIKDGQVLFSLPQGDGSYNTLQTNDPETLHAIDGILFLNDPEFFKAYGKTILMPEPSPVNASKPVTLERTVKSEDFYSPFLQNSGRVLEGRDSLKADWTYGDYPEKSLTISGNFSYYLDTVNALLNNLPFEDANHFRWPGSISTAPPQCHIQITYSQINHTGPIEHDF
ncbi:hypothetical protein [Eubacterium sp. 1001713B170207_170306_E7]|uniref:hypothetical protein n=1 Tax=Eubacterium sp. 1001713B170207_170306_E7 TaxID=2787097 RepID=UPI00189B474D|nr:hypothetical protein [Eubacterium sp. 1001713B170207_170306_E7]